MEFQRQNRPPITLPPFANYKITIFGGLLGDCFWGTFADRLAFNKTQIARKQAAYFLNAPKINKKERTGIQ
ncbi:MAG TPA: hypothetical protein VN658_07625 [Candidatus Acidoferrales bacterium]|nr:hypothetical protein [Candidatus Acidoferrales bacterium]